MRLARIVRDRSRAPTPSRRSRRCRTSSDDAGGGHRLELRRARRRVRRAARAARADRRASSTGFCSRSVASPARCSAASPLAVEPLLDAGDALVVDVDVADHVRDLGAVRIDALVLGEEADAGQAEPVDLLLLLRRDLALEPDEAALATTSRSRTSVASRSGSTAVSSSTASSTSMMLARLGEQRRRAHVGREDLAVAVEDVGPRGRDRVLADGCGARRGRRHRREHHEPHGDDAIDDGESDDGEADARARLDVAVDVAAVEQRAQRRRRLAGGVAGACRRRRSRCGHRVASRCRVGAARCRSAVGDGTVRCIGADRIGASGGDDVGGRSGRRSKRVELRRLDRLAAADGARPGPGCAPGLSSFAHSARSAAMASRSRRTSPRSLATRSACTRRLELDLVDVGRGERSSAPITTDVEEAHGSAPPQRRRRAPAGAAAARRRRRRAAAHRCARRRAAWPSARADWRAISASSATTGRLVSTRKRRRRARSTSGRVARAGRARRLRAARNVLTMRSSSEWNDDHDQPAAGLEHALGRGKRRGEFAELVVDEDAQRLERARRRMDVAGPRAHDAGDDVGERARGARSARSPRARRWRGRRRAHGAPRRGSQMMVGEIALGRARDDVGGARALAAHAHVERPVEAEGEAALGLVELHRGDAEIEHDAVDARRGRSCARRRRDRRSDPRPASSRPLAVLRPDRRRARSRSGRGRCRSPGSRPPRGWRAYSRRRRRWRRYRRRRRARRGIRPRGGRARECDGPVRQRHASAAAARHHSRAPSAFRAATWEPSSRLERADLLGGLRELRAKAARLPDLKLVTQTDEGDRVRDPGMALDRRTTRPSPSILSVSLVP